MDASRVQPIKLARVRKNNLTNIPGWIMYYNTRKVKDISFQVLLVLNNLIILPPYAQKYSGLCFTRPLVSISILLFSSFDGELLRLMLFSPHITFNNVSYIDVFCYRLLKCWEEPAPRDSVPRWAQTELALVSWATRAGTVLRIIWLRKIVFYVLEFTLVTLCCL